MTFFGQCLFTYLGILCLIGFALCGLDKWKAQHSRWRVPERVLFGVSFLGGGLGFFIGMRLFRHKTRHWYFQFGFPVLLLLQAGALCLLWWNFGL